MAVEFVSKGVCRCVKRVISARTASRPPTVRTCPPRTQLQRCKAEGHKGSNVCLAQYQAGSQATAPAIPKEFTGASREAYLAGFKNGYAAGVQVTVNVSLDSGKNLKAVEYSGGVQQDSLLRSLLKGLVWRVFSTALTVSIILAVFHDTVQVEQALKIGGLEFVLKLVVYFAHERLWVQIGDSIN